MDARKDDMMDEYEDIIAIAKNLSHSLQKSSSYAIVAKAFDGTVYSAVFENYDVEEENNFIHSLSDGNAEIKYILCMRQKECLDIPSYHMRKELLETTVCRDETKVVLMGENGNHLRELKTLF